MSNHKRPRKRRRGQRDMSIPVHEVEFEVGETISGRRIDSFLSSQMSWYSRARVQKLITEGRVRVETHKDRTNATIGAMKVGLKLLRGQKIIVTLENPQPAPDQIGDDPGELQVVFEDEYLIAVNKPAGINVHPSHGHLTGSMIHLVHERHREMYGTTQDMPTLCHRLDRETSGLVLCAKDQLSRSRIGQQFESRTVKKAYQALVVGEIPEDGGLIDLPIGKDLESEVRLRMCIRMDEDGLPSQTEWKVARREHGFSLVELYPKTGRTHQLRVHLAHLGYPIVGDKLYMGGNDVFLRNIHDELTDADREILILSRQALHSWKLTIEHPMTGREIELVAPLWPDMAEF